MRTVVLLAALAIGACAETPRQAANRATEEERTRASLDRELVGLTPGPPQTCLDNYAQRDSNLTSFGDTLVYRSGRTRYVTRTTGCRGLGADNILVTRVYGGQICRGDIATTVDRTSRFTTGSCAFGDFVPYRPSR